MPVEVQDNPSRAIMTEEVFRSLAFRRLRIVGGYFLLFILLWFFGAKVALWAEHSRGWEAQVVIFIAWLVSGLSGILALMFAIGVVNWFQGYSRALAQARSQPADSELFLIDQRDVVGPFRWRS